MPFKQCILNFFLQLLFFSSFAQSTERSNILWISCEDISPRLSFYGDSTIKTPNLERLASEGVVYDNVFTTAGVCAPSRCAIITGVNQVTAGGHNMRTLDNELPEQKGVPKSYSIVPPPEIKAFPEYLRAQGYYCTNNFKTDYQFEAPPTVWDETSYDATWRNRKPGQPFFAVFNYVITHESQVWKRKDHPLHVDPSTVPVPPIYPDTKTVRKDIARFYSNIIDLDSLIGGLLHELEADGLMDNTIIFFWSDHGDGLPFCKRELYDRGLKIPLIVKYPDKRRAGEKDDRLISTIDFAPTVLSLAGIKPPSYMQGSAFLGSYKGKVHPYIYAARDRMDDKYDRVRAVRDTRYKYIRNFHSELPLYQDIKYRLQQDMMEEMLEMRDKGQLNSTQMKWFEKTKPVEEIYDTKNDKWELNNLAGDMAYQSQLIKMRKEMDNWLKRVSDLGAIPEKELVKKMWNGNDSPPVTDEVVISIRGKKAILKCATKGASIAYKIIEKDNREPETWQVYTNPILLLKTQTIKAVAQRIGYEKSEETTRDL